LDNVATGSTTGLDAEQLLEADAVVADDALAAVEAKAAEHLNDLQRLQAEYVNYRKRVERDREAVVDLAIGRVIEGLVPVLDDIAAARNHGELDGPFAAIADKLEATLRRLGWVAYGAEGDTFDPSLHEALASAPEPSVTQPTVREVAQLGHRLGDRVLRPARVVVAQPE
jgi:molecular chaperone GrpE